MDGEIFKGISNKVIAHNLTFKGIEIVPGVLDFDQRGIVFANQNDIVITKTKPDPDYLQYLQTLGWNFSNTLFVSPKINSNWKYNSIFHDNKIRKLLSNKTGYYFDTYNTTKEEFNYSRRIKLPIFANCNISQKYGTKSGFRKLCKKLKLNIPEGYEHITSVKKAKEAIEKLFKHGVSTIAIKLDEGISGAGTTRIIKEEYVVMKHAQKNNNIRNSIHKLKQINKSSGVSIEEWINGVISSPSIQLLVTPAKKIRIVSIHDQLLEGEEKWYTGCSYPSTLNGELLDHITNDSYTITKALIAKGFIGYLGLDLIVTSEGKYFWIEANLRKPGTFYPRIIAQKIYGSLNKVNYFATDFNFEKYKNIRFSVIQKLLHEQLLPINKEKRGVVLYNTGALEEGGRFDVVCFGKSANDARTILNETKLLLQSKY